MCVTVLIMKSRSFELMECILHMYVMLSTIFYLYLINSAKDFFRLHTCG